MNKFNYSIKTYQRSKVSAQEYRKALNTVIKLDQEIFFYDANSDDVADKSFRDTTDVENIIILLMSHKRTIGFSFFKFTDLKLHGNKVRVFENTMGIYPEHVGNNLLAIPMLLAFFRVSHPWGPKTYLVSFVSNPGMYRKLASNMRNVYPTPNYCDPTCMESQVLEAAIDRWQTPAAEDIKDAQYFLTYDLILKSKRDFEPKGQLDHFFLKHNPNYKDGLHLGICCQLSMRRVLYGLLTETKDKIKKLRWSFSASR